MKLGGHGVSLPTSKILSLRRAKRVVKCTSARQPTGKRTIGELLLQKVTDKSLAGQLLTPPKISEATSLHLKAKIVKQVCS